MAAMASSKNLSLHKLSILELVRAISSDKVSKSNVLQFFLHRALQLNESSHSVVELMESSDTVLQKTVNGIERGSLDGLRPLEGVPILVKDSLDVEGLHTTCGTSVYSKKPPATRDAKIVANLRELGAVPIGKTNLPEFSLDVQSFNQLFGVTENPYAAGVTAGGSSGGSAAAVALGMAPLAVGTDWVGSLRIPAAFCGVCTIRASRGRMTVDGTDSILPPMPTNPEDTGEVYVSGVFTRTMPELQYALGAIWGTNSVSNSKIRNSKIIEFNQKSMKTLLPENFTVGITNQLPGVPTDRRIISAFDDILEKFEEPIGIKEIRDTEGRDIEGRDIEGNDTEGRDIEDRDIEEKGFVGGKRPKIFGKPLEAPNWNWRELDKAMKVFSSGWTWQKESELKLRRQQVGWAREVQARHTKAVEDFLSSSEIGAWILPVCGVLPFEHNFDHKPFNVNGQDVPYWRPLRGYVLPFTVSGHPVVTMPLKLIDGRPCGIQVVGQLGKDEELLSLCVQLEKCFGQLPPPKDFQVIKGDSRHSKL